MPHTTPDDDNRQSRLTAAYTIAEGTAPIGEHVAADLAAGLLEIAELAMPDTYFDGDSRCQLARAVLERLNDPRAEQYRR